MRTIQLLFFFLFSIVCWSQYSIDGTITDENGLPLKGAHVHIASKITSTLPNGAFLLEKIPEFSCLTLPGASVNETKL